MKFRKIIRKIEERIDEKVTKYARAEAIKQARKDSEFYSSTDMLEKAAVGADRKAIFYITFTGLLEYLTWGIALTPASLKSVISAVLFSLLWLLIFGWGGVRAAYVRRESYELVLERLEAVQ